MNAVHAGQMSATPSVSVDLQVVSDAFEMPAEYQIFAWVSNAIEAVSVEESVGYELAVRLVDEAESQALNKQYRYKDSPTNVLSFPFAQMAGLPADEARPLGDLVICAPVVLREAAQQGKNAQDHWAHMVIHGTLHLFGYRHETDDQAALMETIEKTVLQGFGIENPYTRIDN